MVEGRERCWGRVGEVRCCLPQVLSIHIFSEEDLLFLNTLEVSEEEFQVLKAEQGILVDFAHFPGKVISLLEKCVQAGLGAKPRSALWLCVLWQQCLRVAGCVIQTCQEQPSGCYSDTTDKGRSALYRRSHAGLHVGFRRSCRHEMGPSSSRWWKLTTSTSCHTSRLDSGQAAVLTSSTSWLIACQKPSSIVSGYSSSSWPVRCAVCAAHCASGFQHDSRHQKYPQG